MKTMQDLLDTLGVSTLPAQFEACFEASAAAYEKSGVPFLQDAFLDMLQDKWEIFHEKWDFVKKSAKRVRKSDFFARFSLLLYHALENRGEELMRLCEIPRFADPEAQVDLEMATFFAFLAFVPEIADYYSSCGVPRDIVCATLTDCYENAIRVCYGCFGRDGFEIKRLFVWQQHYLNHRILRVGRLNFEIKYEFSTSAVVLGNKQGAYKILMRDKQISPNGQIVGTVGEDETAFFATFTETPDAFVGYEADVENAVVIPTPVTLPKSEWEVVADDKTHTVNVHIPEDGAFTPEVIEAAYRKCLDLFGRCLPDFHPRAFTCHSWMMDPQLAQFLRPASNIVAFQRKYLRYPSKTDGKAPFMFLFRKPAERLEDLVEDTSLQRKVKAHYLAGKHLYTPGGIFMTDDL